MAERHAAQVANQYRRTARLPHDDRTDLFQSVNQADTADHIALIAARYTAASGIVVVVVDRIDDIGHSKTVVLELRGIEIELIFGGKAAEIHVIDHAGNGLQGRNELPALDLRQFLEILGV